MPLTAAIRLIRRSLGSPGRGPTALKAWQRLGDDLASDEATLARPAEEVQTIDIAIQTIAAAASLVFDADDTSTASRLENLRASSVVALGKPNG